MRKFVLIASFLSLALPLLAQQPVKVRARLTHGEEYREYDSWTVGTLPGFAAGQDAGRDQYGGSMAVRYGGTGFFRVERIKGRWWMLTPDGHPYIAASVGEVKPIGSERSVRVFNSLFGDMQTWARQELAWIKSLGFTAIGRCYQVIVKDCPEKVPYCVSTLPMTNYVIHLKRDLGYKFQNAMPVVFDDAYDEYLLRDTRWLSVYKNDPYCIGIFTDNELFWTDKMLKVYLEELPEESQSRMVAQQWLDERLGKAGSKASEASPEIIEDFKNYCLDTYLRRTSEYLRKYDPNHMYLGNRFYSRVAELGSEKMLRTAGKYFDVLSVNYYTKWTPDFEEIDRWSSLSGCPVLISEFYAKAEDSGLPNKMGAGWIVPSQEDRGVFYENCVIGFVKDRNVVAWQWFKYQDNDVEDKTADLSDRDSNKGLKTWDFQPYDALVRHMAAANAQIYNLAAFFDR